MFYKIEDFIAAAEKYGASDLHLSVNDQPRIRINGKLKILSAEGAHLTKENVDNIIQTTQEGTLKERCLELLEKDGSVDYSYEMSLGGKPLRYRCQVYRSMGRMSIAMRRIRYNIPTFSELRLPDIYESLMKNVEQKGIIIIGGETGSGKSSTLAAMIGYLSRRPDKHIVTVEDPVEYIFRDTKGLIHQRELGLDFPK